MNSRESLESRGVDTLINELKNKGVSAGQDQAKKIVADAQERAKFLINQAELEAQEIVRNAKISVAQEKAAAEEAIRLAARDLILDMKSTLQHRLTHDIQAVVSNHLQSHEFVEKFVLALAGKVRNEMKLDELESFLIELPATAEEKEPVRIAEKFAADGVGQWVSKALADMIREGVEFGTHSGKGIRIQLQQGVIEVDLTEEALTNLLLDRLQPRFRALLDAIWKEI